MVKLEGNFELQSQDNYKEYLLSMGVSEEQANKVLAYKGPLVIGPVEADKLTISTLGQTEIFPLNKEYKHVLGSGQTVWTTTSISGDVITFKTKVTEDGSLSAERVIKATDSGLEVALSNSKGVKASRQYKRL